MSTVRTKFTLTSITRVPHTEYIDGKAHDRERATIQLSAVKDDLFGPATPDGAIRMTIANEAAAAVFHKAKMGGEFIVTFQSAKEWEALQEQDHSPLQSVQAGPGSQISGVTQSIR